MNMTLKISSTPTNIQKIEHFVQNLCSELNVPGEKYCNILISMTEAVNNAIRHGNNLDENKYVMVRSGLEKRKLIFVISDEGSGFDPENIEDPTKEENIYKCGGRGVFLIRQLADDVDFLDNGSTIKLAFQI